MHTLDGLCCAPGLSVLEEEGADALAALPLLLAVLIGWADCTGPTAAVFERSRISSRPLDRADRGGSESGRRG